MADQIVIRIERRDGPGAPARWEEFKVPNRPNANVISVLMEIQRNPLTSDGKRTTPPAIRRLRIGGTKHPQEAEEFVRWYLTNSDSLKIGVKDIGWYPSNKSALTFPEVTSPDPYYSNKVVDDVFINGTLNPGWTWPPNLTAVNQFMGDDFNAAITNKTGLAAALDKLQDQVVKDLKDQHINVVS